MGALIFRISVGSVAFFFFTALLVVSWDCAHAGREIPEKYSPLKLSEGLGQPREGMAAWSPEGKRLAYIGKHLQIYDSLSGRRSLLKFKGAYFVSWASEGELLVLRQDGEATVLGRVDAESLKVSREVLHMRVGAVYPLDGGRRLLLTSSRVKQTSSGLEVRYGLSVYDLRAGTLGEVYSVSRVLPIKAEAWANYLDGWLEAGPNPVGGEMLLLEIIDPPALEPYLKISTVDHLAGRKEEVTRIQHGRFRASGSWSSAGGRAALADEEGRLRLLGLGGEVMAVEDSVTGLYPSWNPRGNVIFFGGCLVAPDGTGKESILPDGGESAAFWSPDGTRMALLTDGELWLLDGFSPGESPLKEGLKGKARILADLYREGLLTKKEYYERYDTLIRRYGRRE